MRAGKHLEQIYHSVFSILNEEVEMREGKGGGQERRILNHVWIPVPQSPVKEVSSYQCPYLFQVLDL